MNMLKHTITALLVSCASFSFGAESGRVGEASTSRFTITLALQPALEITTATDISINIDNRDVDVTYRQRFCVRGTPGSKYTVTATGDTGVDGRFVLRSGSEILPYSLSYFGNPGSASSDQLTDGDPSRVYNILPFSANCNGSTYFIVTFESLDLRNAGSGLYNGSLTFLVSPV